MNILFFCVCATICVVVFSRANVVNRESVLLNKAVQEAQIVAESYKAAHGDFEKTAQILAGDEGVLRQEGLTLTYAEGEDAELLVELVANFQDDYLAVADVAVLRAADGSRIYELPVTVLTGGESQ